MHHLTRFADVSFLILNYFAESLSWYSFDLWKHSCTPLSVQSLFMADNRSSENGSVSSILAMTSNTIFASDYKYSCNYKIIYQKTTMVSGVHDKQPWYLVWYLIHSFTQTISIAPPQVHYYYSEALLTQHGYCAGISRRSTTGNCEWRTCPRSLRGG